MIGRRSIPVLMSLMLASVVAADEVRTRTVAPDGTVYEVLAGPAGELFPDHPELAPESQVLALDAALAGQERSRFLVPGTADPGEETNYLLVHDDPSDAVFILYQGRHNGFHPMIRLARFDGDSWGELVDVISNPFASKISPRMLLTREERVQEGSRTSIHVVWAEEVGEVRRTLHALVLLQDGEYLGWSPIFDLGSLVDDLEPAGGELTPEVADLYSATSGNYRRSMVVGFVEPRTGRLLTVEMEMLPSELVGFAERLRTEIIGIGWRSLTADGVEDLVMGMETGLHGGLRTYVAAHLAEITALEGDAVTSADGLVALADRLRTEIIGIGSRVGAGAVEVPTATRLFEVGQTPQGGAPHHLLKSTVHLDLQVPEGVGEEARLLVAPSGERAAIAWVVENRVVFVEGSADGWSPAATLDLEQLGLDLEGAFALVADELGES